MAPGHQCVRDGPKEGRSTVVDGLNSITAQRCVPKTVKMGDGTSECYEWRRDP